MIGNRSLQGLPWLRWHRGLMVWTTVLAIAFFFSKRPKNQNQILLSPQLEWKESDGIPRKLSDLRGSVVLIHFWAKWCHPCIQEMPELALLEKKFSHSPFQLLAPHVNEITNEERQTLSLQTYPKNLIWEFDTAALDFFDVSAIPTSYLIDKNGKLQATFQGPQNWLSRKILARIDQWVNEPGDFIVSSN